MELLIDSYHGIYILQVFAEYFPQYFTPEEIKISKSPENDGYFELWDKLDSLQMFDDSGKPGYILQVEGDVYFIYDDEILPEDLFY